MTAACAAETTPPATGLDADVGQADAGPEGLFQFGAQDDNHGDLFVEPLGT